MTIKTAAELAAACKKAAGYKTLYVSGCFGAPMTAANKNRYCGNNDYNRRPERTKLIRAATADTFGFDCVCLIKGLLWGWSGDQSAVYGGAAYQSNGVPDINESMMINACSGVSTDFSAIQPGEAVWMPGHIGVYIGDGLAVECTPAWKNGVQITACNRDVAGYNRRNWTKHGKLPYVTYPAASADKPCLPELAKGSRGNAVRAMQILLIGNGCSCGIYGADGDFGNGTYNAVLAYQKKKGIEVDGICGPETWKSLLGLK